MKRKLFFIILLVVFEMQLNYAQNSIVELSKQIEILYQKGESIQSKSLFNEKISLLKKQDNLEEYLYAYWDFFMLNPSKSRLHLLQFPLDHLWRLPNNEEEYLAYLHLLVNQAFFQKKTGAIYQSILSYESALNYFDTHQIRYNILDYCLKPLANNCTRIGDYQRADDLMIRSLQMATKTKAYNQVISFSNNLAISKQSQGNFNLAIEILNQALQTPRITNIEKSRIHSELARNWYKKKNYQTAIEEVEKTFHYQKKTKDPEILIHSYTTKGLCFIALGKLKKAKNEIKHAIELAFKTYQSNDREIAKLYLLLAEIATERKDYAKALFNFQKSLQTLLSEYKPKTVFDNPNSDSFFPENTIKEALDGRARIFTLQKDYTNALKNYDLSFKEEELLRNTYSSQNSKIIQQTENRNRSSQVIDLCYKLYEQKQDNQYILKAFNYAEQTKSLVLLDEFQNKKWVNQYQKDSLFIKLQELNYQKALLSKEIQLAIYHNESENNLSEVIKNRSEITNQLQIVKHEIEKKYGLYSSYKYLDWQKIQNRIIIDKKLVIEYFIGTTFTTIFKLDADKELSWRKIKNSSYFGLLQAYFPFFSTESGGKITDNLDEYKELAFAVYNQLLAKELEDVKTKKLVIIPDGMISFIPFDALLVSGTESRSFQKIPFLLKEQEISYGYSLSIMIQPKLTKIFNNTLIGFFLEFNKKQRDLSALPYTQKEKEKIKSHFVLTVFEKEKATKKAFMANSQEARIIHLSTHANTKTQNKLASIEFWDEPLYLTELYGHQIHADLVVLSACETGIGVAQKGEGAMSLARGFSYAGVKNLVVSLWKVNDKATSIFMGDFYKFLSKNRTCTAALHEAKFSYLNNKDLSNTKKSPYYWASFILIKNTSEAFALDSKAKSSYGLYYLALFIVLGLFVWYRIKKRRKFHK